MAKGIYIKCKEPAVGETTTKYEHMAISLLPVPFPKLMYEQAKEL
jgi:hypothetical protein